MNSDIRKSSFGQDGVDSAGQASKSSDDGSSTRGYPQYLSREDKPSGEDNAIIDSTKSLSSDSNYDSPSSVNDTQMGERQTSINLKNFGQEYNEETLQQEPSGQENSVESSPYTSQSTSSSSYQGSTDISSINNVNYTDAQNSTYNSMSRMSTDSPIGIAEETNAHDVPPSKRPENQLHGTNDNDSYTNHSGSSSRSDSYNQSSQQPNLQNYPAEQLEPSRPRQERKKIGLMSFPFHVGFFETLFGRIILFAIRLIGSILLPFAIILIIFLFVINF